MRKSALLLSGLFMISFCAGTAFATQDANQLVAAALNKLVPSLKPDSIKPSEVTGLYEAAYGPQIIFVTADGKYVIRGEAMSVENRRNITADKVNAARLGSIQKLGPNAGIVFAAAKPKHTITVFTDVDCPYCRKLHSEIGSYNKLGISVQYLAFPRAGVNSPTYNKMVSVWCSENKRDALTKATDGQDIPAKTCDNQVKAEFALGEAMGVKGTPTIITDSGRLVPGYMTADALAQEMGVSTNIAAKAK